MLGSHMLVATVPLRDVFQSTALVQGRSQLLFQLLTDIDTNCITFIGMQNSSYGVMESSNQILKEGPGGQAICGRVSISVSSS
jgi:hypothetical protein